MTAEPFKDSVIHTVVSGDPNEKTRRPTGARTTGDMALWGGGLSAKTVRMYRTPQVAIWKPAHNSFKSSRDLQQGVEEKRQSWPGADHNLDDAHTAHRVLVGTIWAWRVARGPGE